MASQLPIVCSDRPLSSLDASAFSRTVIERDWYGKPLDRLVEYNLVLDPITLHFSVSVSATPYFDARASLGQYVEGLWEYDVAEFFLADEQSGAYQEFNLGPQGAWWSSRFRGYRERDTRCSLSNLAVHCISTHDSAGWSASLSVPRSEIAVENTFSTASRANVTFILQQPTATFCSVAPLVSKLPDFHLADQFIPFAPTASRALT